MFYRILFSAFTIVLLFISQSLAQTPNQEAFASSYRYERAQDFANAINAILVLPEKGYLYDLRLGWLYYLSGNYANARLHYQAAVTLAPAAIKPRLGLTLPLLAQLRYDEVESVAKQILMVDPSNYTANLRLCIALRNQKKDTPAIEVTNRMLKLYPTDVSFLIEQGLLLVATGQLNAAQKPFEMVLTLDPENVTAKTQLNAK